MDSIRERDTIVNVREEVALHVATQYVFAANGRESRQMQSLDVVKLSTIQGSDGG